MTDQGMVERVARSIAKCQAELGEDKWRYCLPEARAAIETMREPTEAMDNAYDKAIIELEYVSARGNEVTTKMMCRHPWDAMIDAALSGK